MTTGSRLKALRVLHRVKQKDLIPLTGKSRTTVIAWEGPDEVSPDVEAIYLEALAVLTGRNVTTLRAELAS